MVNTIINKLFINFIKSTTFIKTTNIANINI